MKILFVGYLWQGSTSLQRMNAYKHLGHDVTGVNFTPTDRSREQQIIPRLLYRLGFPVDLTGANRRILELACENHFDVMWVEKGLTISPETLVAVKNSNPECRLVFFSPDNMLYRKNQSRRYLDCLPLYDLHVTTKSHNVDGLVSLGAKDVFFINKSFDPATHRPIDLTPAEKKLWGAEVGFVGEFEIQRHEMSISLARSGIPVNIRGPGWEKYICEHPNYIVRPGWVYDVDYTRAICATKINLCFLRKIVGDQQTARSVEIPACGAFMLAERTDEHLALFVEGKEAEFFDSQEELLDKAKYYLGHDNFREKIAAAGRKRCLKSGYRHQDRLRAILDHLQGKQSCSYPGSVS